MKKFLAFLILLSTPAFAATQLKDEGSSQGYVNIVDCVGAGIDCTVSGITGTLTVSGGVGTGDIDAVGDVASGAAFNGTQGTTLTFNDADGDKTFKYDTANNWFEVNAALAIGSAGVRITDDGDGAITLLGMGNGFDEDLTLNLDDVSNIINISSSTAVGSLSIDNIDILITESTTNQEGKISIDSAGSAVFDVDRGGTTLSRTATFGWLTAGVYQFQMGLTDANDTLYTNDEAGNTLFSITDAGTTGNATLSGDLTISGDDLFMATNTSGAVLVGDGTNFNPVVMAGDVAIGTTGTATIQANSVALGTDTTNNYVATIADSGASEVTVANSGTESAAVTLALASTITRDSEWNGLDFLVGTATGTLSGEIAVGTSPGGELGGTWASPTIDDNVTVTGWELGTVTSGALTASGKIIGNANIDVKNGATSSGIIAIFEDSDDGVEKATFQVPALAADTAYILPPDDGEAGEQLQTNGAGTLTWEAAGAGGATAWNDIGDATVDGTVDFVATEQDIVGQLDSNTKSMLTITNQDADRTANTAILTLNDYDKLDDNMIWMVFNSDVDGTPVENFKLYESSVGGVQMLLGATGVYFNQDGDGALTIGSLGDGFQDTLTINLDDTDNTAVFSDMATYDFAGIVEGDSVQIDSSTTGVKIDSDGDGMLIMTGTSAGNDEDLRFNLDDGVGGANTVELTSGTGVTDLDTNINVRLAENTSIVLDPAGSADGKYSGITITATSGYTQAFGDLVYLDPTDSRWEAVDGNAAAAADGDARGPIGMVVVAANDGSTCKILLQGTIRADANFPALTIGAPVYAAETAGDIVVAQPTTTDAVIRIVGFALTADEIYFNPSQDYMTHT